MSKGHSFGFPGLRTSFSPFLDPQAHSKSAPDRVHQHSFGTCHVLPSIPGPDRAESTQTCWDTLPVRHQGTTRAALTPQLHQQGVFPSRLSFHFLSLSLLLLWFNNWFLTGKNKVQPPAETELSSMQSVLPGRPLLGKENSLQTLHGDRASSRG